MDNEEEARLKLAVSGLYELAVVNLSTVMNLSHALLSSDNLPAKARIAAQCAFDSIQSQIDILQKISDVEGENA
ncbi:hypothetical protein [Pseudomonas syringae]|uniref:hypothetical protein n=1 Tax=Pseudomonas syringae TaxID=317 RepID=UPI003F74DA9D